MTRNVVWPKNRKKNPSFPRASYLLVVKFSILARFSFFFCLLADFFFFVTSDDTKKKIGLISKGKKMDWFSKRMKLTRIKCSTPDPPDCISTSLAPSLTTHLFACLPFGGADKLICTPNLLWHPIRIFLVPSTGIYLSGNHPHQSHHSKYLFTFLSSSLLSNKASRSITVDQSTNYPSFLFFPLLSHFLCDTFSVCLFVCLFVLFCSVQWIGMPAINRGNGQLNELTEENRASCLEVISTTTLDDMLEALPGQHRQVWCLTFLPIYDIHIYSYGQSTQQYLGVFGGSIIHSCTSDFMVCLLVPLYSMQIHVMKIDVEGYESQVRQTLRGRENCVIWVRVACCL